MWMRRIEAAGKILDSISWPERMFWLFGVFAGPTILIVGPYEVTVSLQFKLLMAAFFLLIVMAASYLRVRTLQIKHKKTAPRIAALTDGDLRSRAIEFAAQMRHFEADQWNLHSATRESRLQDYRNVVTTFRNEYLGVAKELRGELERRLKEGAFVLRSYSNPAAQFVEDEFWKGHLAGPHPINEMANYLEGLARKLPAD